MGKIAFVFSGQGAQHDGMGSDLYNNIDLAKNLFEQFEEIKPGTKNLCFNGTKEDLSQTENTQPCLYAVDLIAALCLKEKGIIPDVLAGFSLGELAALSFAGSMSYKEGFEIVCKRGQYMQLSGEENDSVMMAVVKLDNETVENLCKKYNQVYPVNYNCNGQLVVSGLREEMDLFKVDVKEAGGRALPLSVSGGFHSPFMSSAEKKFKSYLDTMKFNKPEIPVYANYTAEVYTEDVGNLLAKQLLNPVLWQKTIEHMIECGVDTFIEVGVGKTLCKLIQKISDKVKVYNVEDMASLEKTLSEVKNA
ncbi:ACP S-malonyltransferase [Sedimentibacter sp. zth1]|uniref:ACP S-malonyltransferase n=1 Tax=Sedimentibacter sp. zth1 TaxID=2816908 RepID=UPI001A915223|nr:ACP S-malonyltransferase [Sedimentibacter sp. zth1]QSX05545.1 ACP S-malonyltransferase [Sedimentibacter sp. zth1]